MTRTMRWRRFWLTLPLFSITAVLIATTVTQGLSATLPNDSDPRTFLGIGYYKNFDGYAAELGVYYNTWDSSRTIDIRGSLMDVYAGSNCKNHNPTMIGQPWSSGEAYATVRLTVTNGASLNYRITRDNFCRHLSDGNLDEVNSRTALSSARFIGRYQLPLSAPTGPDEETGKYKVTIKISFTTKVVSGYNSAGVYINDDYNPNAYFRVRASGGLVAALGSTESGADLRKVNTRAYTNVLDYNSQMIEFGSPCSLTAGATARFGLYDPDNYFHTGAISGTQGFARPFLFYLEEREDGAAGYTPLASSRYTIIGGSSRGEKVTRSSLNSRGLTTSLPSGITAIESTTRIPSGDTANSPSTVVDFTPKIDAKYRLRLVDVYTMNFLQIVVPFDGIYNSINCDDSTEVEPGVNIAPNPVTVGSQVNTEAWIDNNGSVNSGEVNYVHRIWLDEGSGTFGAGDSEIYRNDGNENIDPDGREDLADVNRNIDDGSMAQVCVGLWLTGVDSTTVVNSPAIACSPIGRYPQTQISGGDVIAEGQVNTVIHEIGANRNYGSWAEYSIFASGNVSSISGASLPAGGYGLVGNRTALTFANSNPPSPPGNFAASVSSFDGDLGLGSGPWQNWATSSIPLPATITSAGQIVPNEINTRSGDITINEALTIDRSYVIYTAGNVIINRSIQYENSSYSSLDELPQLVIIAEGYIRIHPNVRQVDAWLISGSRVLTCAGPSNPNPSPYFAGLNAGNCNRQLTINGPIQAGSLYLRRTGGAGADGTSAAQRSTPAEVINLRSDAYLWAYGQASQGQVIRTDSVKELPPRF